MKLLKTTLILLLIVVVVLYGATVISQRLSGKDVRPDISCPEEILEVSVYDPEIVLMKDVTASDKQDGDLTDRVQILSISKLVTNNTAKVTYLVFDNDGNMDTLVRQVRYTDYSRPVFSIKRPLIYSENEAITLLDRLQVKDVIDGDITSAVRVSALSGTSDAEIYTVSLQVTNSMGDTARLTVPVVLQDHTAFRPDIRLNTYLTYIHIGDTFHAQSYLTSLSTAEGPVDTSKVQITSTVDTSTAGTYYVYYRYPYNGAMGLAVLTVVVQ
jgi:hypothetical protein